ncbi:hypothetical protein TNCV_4037151 [Trichonephila clavipes]|nr:hypothetical protein TNCV_4037151 [Trichonephila clavipes]
MATIPVVRSEKEDRRELDCCTTRRVLVSSASDLRSVCSGQHPFLKVQMSLEKSLVYVARYHIHHMWHYRVRLRESGQPIGRLRKTCKNAFPRTIPVSFGRLDTSIATESSLNVHFLICTLIVIHGN